MSRAITAAAWGHKDGGNKKLNLSWETPSRLGGILKCLRGNIKPLQTHSTCSTLLPLFFQFSSLSSLHLLACFSSIPNYLNYISFLLHAPLSVSPLVPLFPLSFCQTKPPDSQESSTSRTFVLKHFINLAADGPGALAFPISWCLWNKICVKYIWFDWGVFTCFPNSPYGLWVQTNIVSMCVSLCVYMLYCMCVLPDDAWLDLKYSPIICSGMSSPEMEKSVRGRWETEMKGEGE